MAHFEPAAAGYLIQLLRFKLISSSQFEKIIDRGMLLGENKIDLPVLKSIAARYVFAAGTTVDLHWFNIDGSETIN